MSIIESVIKRHATLIYFALVFVISWGGVHGRPGLRDLLGPAHAS